MHVKSALNIYVRNIESILLLGVTIMLPFLIFHNYIVSICYYIGNSYGAPIFGDLTNTFFTILFLSICQIPFIRFTLAEIDGEEKRLKSSYIAFIQYGFQVFVFGIVYVLLFYAGSILFIIPGVLVLLFLYLSPYITVIRKQKITKAWKTSIKLTKKKFLPLFLILLIMTVVELGIGVGLMYGVSLFTQSYLAIVLSQMLLNLLIFPFFVILLTSLSNEWLGVLYAPKTNFDAGGARIALRRG